MPKIVKPNLVKIPARAYRAIRSFVESSLKDDYPWNIGVLTNDNVAVFTKSNKWVLRTYREGGLPVCSLHLPNGELIAKYDTCTLKICDFTISRDRSDLHIHFLVPDSDIPFARPICIVELIDKLNKYPVPD